MKEPPQGITSRNTVTTFIKGRACSDTLFHVLGREFGQPMGIEEKATMPLAGGVGLTGGGCAAILEALAAA
jgi:hypothetical protein